MSISKSQILVRAHEIVARSGTEMLLHDAVKQALREVFNGNADAPLDELARTVTANGTLRKLTYDLPEHNGQTQLFEIPSWLIIQSPEGDLLIPRSEATVGHVRQWRREGLQHHSVQRLRFKRAGEDLDHIKDVEDDVPWSNARALIFQRRAEITA